MNLQHLRNNSRRQPGYPGVFSCECELAVEQLSTVLVFYVRVMLNKNTWGVKKCGANQKQHCKQVGATKRFDIS